MVYVIPTGPTSGAAARAAGPVGRGVVHAGDGLRVALVRHGQGVEAWPSGKTPAVEGDFSLRNCGKTHRKMGIFVGKTHRKLGISMEKPTGKWEYQWKTIGKPKGKWRFYPVVNVYMTMEDHHFLWENSLFQCHVQ